MTQMKTRNAQLKATIGKIPTKEVVKEVVNMPEYDTVNRQGYAAYSVPEQLQLLSMLNTLKIEPQYYRSEDETIRELRDLIFKLASVDSYFVAQAIVWSRCCGEGMRTINHLAAALLAPFASGTTWGKRFYSAFDKKSKNHGGCIYRLDDMSEIKDAFSALNTTVLTNAMKKGFVSVLENASAYELTKYKKTTIDIANLTHPNISKSKATITIDDKEMKVIDALLKGMTISADTWEAINSEAGQIVAQAVRENKLTIEEAEKVLTEAKNDNWESLLDEGKLGILAAVRNLRNILKGGKDSIIDKVAELVQNGDKIRQGKVMPYQLEQAMTIIQNSNPTEAGRKLLTALEVGMTTALPNLKELLTGKTLVMVDCSGSMNIYCYSGKREIKQSCIDKAAILAAMLAKGVNADIIIFGSKAQRMSYNPNDSLSTISKHIKEYDLGGTCISSAFDLIRKERARYDRIILLSDNEANYGCTRSSYKQYITEVCSPYVYCVDLASYGSTPLKNEGKVNYYYGYGYSMLDDIARLNFNPQAHIEKVKQIEI